MTVGTERWTLHYAQFSENFFSTKISPFSLPSSHFPLSTSHHFHFPVDIPSELAPWHRSPCSTTEPGLRSESVFEEQRLIEALNQAWIFTGEFTSPSSCLYLSFPNPVAILYPRCSKSLKNSSSIYTMYQTSIQYIYLPFLKICQWLQHK